MAQNFRQFTLEPPSPIEGLATSSVGGGATLQTGDLLSPNFVHSQAGWRLDSDGNLEALGATFANSTIVQTFLAGEKITASDAVYISDNSSASVNILSNTVDEASSLSLGRTNGSGEGEKIGQSVTFTSSVYLKTLKIDMRIVGTPTDDVVIALQLSDGTDPDDTDIAVTAAVDVGAEGVYTFDFSTAQKLTANQEYFLVLRRDGANNNTNYYRATKMNNNYVAGLTRSFVDGAWQDNAENPGVSADINMDLFQVVPLGQIGRAEADVTGAFETFIGFAKSSVETDELVEVTITGIVESLSGLTPGQYFLSNTKGAIQTSAGSNERKVGIAIAADKLQITSIW